MRSLLHKTDIGPKSKLVYRSGQRLRGQAIVIVALSMVALIAFLGLAIDGGSAYLQRRAAQNASDAAALAAGRAMLDAYELSPDIDGTNTDDTNIRNALNSYANLHHITPGDLQAYYINDTKQVVNSTQVGSLGYVPWVSAGAKGLLVKNFSQADTYFLRLLGYRTVEASATSTAFIGVSADSGNGLPLFPVGFFTGTYGLESMVIGQTYTIIDGNNHPYPPAYSDSDMWAYPDYNNHLDIDIDNSTGPWPIAEAWRSCGFNPRVRSDQWNDWVEGEGCLGYGRVDAGGPALMYPCADTTCGAPQAVSLPVPYVRWGMADRGWWLKGKIGDNSDSCDTLQSIMGTTHNGDFLVPIFDAYTGSDTDARLHLLAVARFSIPNPDIDCHVPDPSRIGDYQAWHIEGTFESRYLPGSTGSHADLSKWSEHTVFLDN